MGILKNIFNKVMIESRIREYEKNIHKLFVFTPDRDFCYIAFTDKTNIFTFDKEESNILYDFIHKEKNGSVLASKKAIELLKKRLK